MKSKSYNTFLLIIIFVIFVIYGFAMLKYELYPYKIINTVYTNIFHSNYPNESSRWSIGLYEGSSLIDLDSPDSISNPIISQKNISDVLAESVADPFMIIRNNNYYIFFEIMNSKTKQGDIGYAESNDGRVWKYKKIIIDETFSLSYPYIFEWNNEYYLIPESHEDLSVRLYKARQFPDKWEYVGNILAGSHFTDPSILRYDNKWWIFVTAYPSSDVLNLYYSNNLLGEWKSHPMNPIVKFNKNYARSGGRIIVDQDIIYRFAQDDYPIYGSSVYAFEIKELSEDSYLEKIVSNKPIINKTGKGWNKTGMHHIDLIKVENKWLAIVDGRN